MPMFRITYQDPETGEKVSVDKEFVKVHEGEIAAREWAEDWAYSMADKGPYKIEELRKCQ